MSGVTEQRVQHSIEIDLPQEQCYNALIHFERYRDFIPQLKSISHKGDEGILEWHLRGPGNEEIAWDMKLDALKHQHDVISWHTVRNADIAHSGAVTMKPVSHNKTRLDFVVEFQPASARFETEQFTRQTKQAIVETIAEFKNHLANHAAYSGSSNPEGAGSVGGVGGIDPRGRT